MKRVVAFLAELIRPGVELRFEGEHAPLPSIDMPMDREAGPLLPALHRPDVAAEVRRDLFPRVEAIARRQLRRCDAWRRISAHHGGQV